MAPPRRNRLPPQLQSNGVGMLEMSVVVAALGVSLFAGFYLAQNFDNPFEETLGGPKPKASDFEFDFEIFMEKKQQLISQAHIEKEMLEKNSKVQNAKRRNLGRNDLHSVPEKFLDRWVPDPTRFKGVQEFLEITKSNGTVVEEFFYLAPPIFQKSSEDKMMIGFATNTQDLLKTLTIGGCNYMPDSECHQTEMEMKDGDLYMHETLTGKNVEMKIIRVFYIPSLELL